MYELIGEEIHEWIGEEPSGRDRSEPIFDKEEKPHNPLVDSGAILVCALIVREGKNINDIINFYKRITLSKKTEIDFELSSQLQILAPSDATLTNLMLAKNKFPKYNKDTETMEKTLEAVVLYQQVSCMLVEIETLTLFGACLANNGKNILNGE